MTNKEALEEIKEGFNLFLKGCGLFSEEQIKVRIEHNDDFRKVYEANMLAIKTLEEKEADRWIPVTERLPSDDEPYEMLCCDNHGEIMIGHPFADEGSECGYSAENEGCYMYECVAWKPLPKPYESEAKK